MKDLVWEKIMQMRDILGFVLLPLAMVIAAWVVNASQLWSNLANMTLPWLCTAIAVSLLALGAVCLVMQVEPAAIPTAVVVWVIIVILVVFGIGMTVDCIAYSRSGDWLASLGEWLGFAVILTGAFVLARLGKA